MERTTQAEMELPIQEIMAAFDLSEDELEAAMMSGMIKVEQEVMPPPIEGEWPNQVKLTLTFAGKVVVMPVALHYPDQQEPSGG
jgi:hypothetical protein